MEVSMVSPHIDLNLAEALSWYLPLFRYPPHRGLKGTFTVRSRSSLHLIDVGLAGTSKPAGVQDKKKERSERNKDTFPLADLLILSCPTREKEGRDSLRSVLSSFGPFLFQSRNEALLLRRG
jgi:hypothetical protein